MLKETAISDRLDAARTVLIIQERELAVAKEAVARRRAAAAQNLRRRQALETQARNAEVRFERLVADHEMQRRTATNARAADLAELRELRGERDRVSVLLRRRAEEAHMRAVAEAAARRKAGQRRLVRAADRRMSWPVGGWISSPFGMRFHPVYKRWSLHDGLDIASPCGIPVRASADGRVLAMYFNSAYGNRVVLDNGFQRGVGVGTTYNHMSGFSAFVGQQVRRGDIIGYVGTTGASTGCHLHFMVLENGRATDPMSWL